MCKHSPESKLDLEKVYLILFLIRMAMLEKPVKMRKIDERFQAIIMKPRNIKTKKSFCFEANITFLMLLQ